MKSESRQKVKSVPSCEADNAAGNDALRENCNDRKQPVGASGSLRPTSTEVNRRARRSAAMIGLAISMGASSLLMPGQGDEAMAADAPIATEPTSTAVSSATENAAVVSTEPKEEQSVAVVSNSPHSEPVSAAVNTPPAEDGSSAAVNTPHQVERESAEVSKPKVIEHEVKPGQTIWQVSQKYQVEPAAIAASNKLKQSSVLPPGQVLKVPSVNGLVHEVKLGDTVESVSKAYGVSSAQLQQIPGKTSSVLPEGEAIAIPGKVNDLLKARQEDARNRLQEKRDRLQNSLAELKSEESSTSQLNLANQQNGSSAVAENPSNANLPTAASEAEVPMVTAPQSIGSVPTPTVSPVASLEKPAAPSVVIPPKTATMPTPTVIPVPSLQTPAPSPLAIAPKPVTVPTPAFSPVPSLETPAASSVAIPPKTATMPIPLVSPVPSLQTPAASSVVVAPKPVTVPTPTVIAVPSPLAIAPTTAPIPNLNIEAEKTPKASAAASKPTATIAEPQVAVPALDYQVKPGDTLDEIAQYYGVSRSELMQVNGIDNPNRLQVSQHLRIPQPKATTLVPGLKTTATIAALGQSPDAKAPSLAVPSLPTSSNLVVAKPSVLSLPAPVAINTLADEGKSPSISSSVGNAASNGTTLIANDVKQSVNPKAGSDSNPYVDKLRLEINKLREQYQNQKENSAAKPLNLTVPTVKPPVSPLSNNASASSEYINPEFNPEAYYNEAKEGENQKKLRPQSLSQQGPIKIQVPAPENPSPRTQRRVVATSPVETDTYNPVIKIPVGQPVSPELPPINVPDSYYPDGEQAFTGYIWPTKGVLTSGYGWRWGRMHKGIDIAAGTGTPIVAAGPGVVVYARWNSGGYGNLVDIRHPDGTMTRYGHNSRLLVREGQTVEQGQEIALMGSTGYSTGPHLHFEVHPSGKGAVNPIALLPRRS